MDLKSHIHTKIRNLFSNWLLPARRIHVTFWISSRTAPMDEIGRRIGIEICEVDTVVKNPVAKPSWCVDVTAHGLCIEYPLREMISMLEPKASVIKEILSEIGEFPTLVVFVESKWSNSPELTLPPDVLKFFAQFDTEICFDINY